MNRFEQFLNIPAEVIDPVRVVNMVVRADLILCAEAIFNTENRNLIAVVKLIQRDPQADRIDPPAPVAFLDIRIFHHPHHVALDFFNRTG